MQDACPCCRHIRKAEYVVAARPMHGDSELTKDVWIKITGYHAVGEEAQEPVVTEARGTYNAQAGKHYLRFQEVTEEGAVTKTLMKFRDGYLEVTKKGGVRSNMCFEVGKTNTTHYNTVAGDLEIDVVASAVTVSEEARRITCSAVYALESLGERLQDSRVEIVVIPFPII